MTPRAAPPEPTPPPPEDRPPVLLTDPRAIRALAHPARLAVIDELYSGRELTATECAEIAGLSPSAMSYHLRSLEKAGIVERAPSTGDGRERPWRAAGSYLQVESRAPSGSGGLAADAALGASVFTRTLEQFQAYLARRSQESQEWIDASGASYGRVWLTPEEAKRIEEMVVDYIAQFRGRRRADRPANARRVRVSIMTFPSDPPEPGAGAP